MCCIRPDQSIGAPDREIFNHAMMQDYTCTFQADQVELLRGFTIYNTGEQCLECLGDRFCVVLSVPEDWNNHTFRVWLIQKLSWFTTKKRTITSVCWVGTSFQSCRPPTDGMSPVEAVQSTFWVIVRRESRFATTSGGSFTYYLYCTIIKDRLGEALNQVRSQIATDAHRAEALNHHLTSSMSGTPMKLVNFQQICLLAILTRTA